MIARALTIAGSDSSGGAGIQADLKTFTVFRVYGMSAVTALTAQNTCGVTGIVPVAPAFVRQQIEAVATDVGVDAAKTGMLANREIIGAVAVAVQAHRISRLVVDPVMVAQTGATLLESDASAALREQLLPLALVVTPNTIEAEVLLNRPVRNIADMRAAARELAATGARTVLVKGGHLSDGDAVDVFFDGSELHELGSPRIATRHTHGTGCMLSAAIAAGLAQGLDVWDAITRAKRFITAAITQSLALGAGNGPANVLAWLEVEDV